MRDAHINDEVMVLVLAVNMADMNEIPEIKHFMIKIDVLNTVLQTLNI